MPADRDDIYDNLVAQSERLRRLEEVGEGVLAGEYAGAIRASSYVPGGDLTYEAITEANRRWLRENAMDDRDLDSCLSEADRARLLLWREGQREPWNAGDYVTVGLCGVIGAVSSLYDTQLDRVIRSGMERLRQTDLFKTWEKAAQGMPIDYTGPNFGGPGHRMRSAGHDIGRPFEALSQIRDGQFRGTYWEDGIRHLLSSPDGAYAAVPGWAAALILWAKHLAADLVTPMSLPVPGWTKLYELDSRNLRKFAHEAYNGNTLGEGLNIRSAGATPLLNVLTSEVIVRSRTHWVQYTDDGTFKLNAARRRKRDEMLLAAQSLVGALCIGHACFSSTFEGSVALRHINVPVLAAAGGHAVQVVRAQREHSALAPKSWTELAEFVSFPWELDAAKILEEMAREGGKLWGPIDTPGS